MKKFSLLDLSFDEVYEICPFTIKYYLSKCEGLPQTFEWHSEGDVLTHIRIVFNRAKRTGDINLLLAALFHDLGKVDTTVKHPTISNKWTAKLHEKISTKIVKKHKNWIEQHNGDFDIVLFIVEQHMRVKQLDEMRLHKRKILMQHPYYHFLDQFTKLDDMSIDYSDDLN
jgi:predicted HD phosphohydrolase